MSKDEIDRADGRKGGIKGLKYFKPKVEEILTGGELDPCGAEYLYSVEKCILKKGHAGDHSAVQK
jgi:hypothetical protein